MFWFIAGLTFTLFLVMNLATPLEIRGDDAIYSSVFHENRPVASMNDVITSQVNLYDAHTGRVLVHGLLQFFIWIGKDYFNWANAVVYLIFVFSIYLHIKGSKKEYSPLLLLAINGFLWIFVPSFGMCFLWLTGACNYLWAMTLVLVYLLSFRLMPSKSPGVGWIICTAVFGLLAGATAEISGGASIFATLIWMIYSKRETKKIPVHMMVGLFSTLCGFLFMILAPGNFVRLQSTMVATDNTAAHNLAGYLMGNGSIGARLLSVLNKLYEIWWVLIPLFIVFVLLINTKREKPEVQKLAITLYLGYFLCGFACIGACFLSPGVPFRVMLFPITFFVIAIGIAADNMQPLTGVWKQIAVGIAMIILPYLMLSYGKAMIDITITRTQQEQYLASGQNCADFVPSPHTKYNLYFEER